jgi:hypothetical protein
MYINYDKNGLGCILGNFLLTHLVTLSTMKPFGEKKSANFLNDPIYFYQQEQQRRPPRGRREIC